MKINKRLLAIKFHYFLFMGAMGPILPQLPLFGKDIGISPVVMGTVTGILPFTFVLTKFVFGLFVDVYRQSRKHIFLGLIITMTLCFYGIYYVPVRDLATYDFKIGNSTNFSVTCEADVRVVCNSSCLPNSTILLISNVGQICPISLPIMTNTCRFVCIEDLQSPALYRSLTFWSFIFLMSLGTIGFNVINSFSDAICFDIVADQGDYGAQRLWGSVGFGLAGLISGYVVDLFSADSVNNYMPAFATMLIFFVLDFLVCLKLELPIIEPPENILKDLKILLRDPHVVIFITFAVLAGMLDGLVIYFLFWYLEDLALQTNTSQIKLIEGLTLAAETLGGETIFFFISGKILEKLGHVSGFTLCFLNYGLRFGLIYLAPNPWWILFIELFMQGPTFALTYTVIVRYANELAPPGMSATMQGLAAGMGDGTGYAIGSILGGLSFRYFGGRATFHAFTWVALICGFLHFVIHKKILRSKGRQRKIDYAEIE